MGQWRPKLFRPGGTCFTEMTEQRKHLYSCFMCVPGLGCLFLSFFMEGSRLGVGSCWLGLLREWDTTKLYTTHTYSDHPHTVIHPKEHEACGVRRTISQTVVSCRSPGQHVVQLALGPALTGACEMECWLTLLLCLGEGYGENRRGV